MLAKMLTIKDPCVNYHILGGKRNSKPRRIITCNFVFSLFFNPSKTLVIDGKDGAILWNTTSGRYDVTSDLTVKTTARNRDMFLFRMQGRKGKDPRPQGAIHGATGIQRVVLLLTR